MKLRFGSMLLTDLVWRPRRFCCNDIGSRCTGAVGELSPPDRSCGAVEQIGDDDGLSPDIMTVNLSKLSLPHHRYRFETRQSSPRGMKTCRSRA